MQLAYIFILISTLGRTRDISFWKEALPGIFITIVLASIFFFNTFDVKMYREVEFFSSIMKVILIADLIFFALIDKCGGIARGNVFAFCKWKAGGLFRAYLVESLVSFWVSESCSCTLNSLIMVLTWCEWLQAKSRCFIRTLVSQQEIIYQNLLVLHWKICLHELLVFLGQPSFDIANGKSCATSSSWVIGIKIFGFHSLDSLVNAVVMTSVWSCGNGLSYNATKIAYSADIAGYLPIIFVELLKIGCLIVAVTLSMVIGCLSYVSVYESLNTVFDWFINLDTTGILFTYFAMWMCYSEFRKAVKIQ